MLSAEQVHAGTLAWVCREGSPGLCCLRAAFTAGSTHHGPCTHMGNVTAGRTHTGMALAAGVVRCGQRSPWATHTHGQCHCRQQTQRDGAHCRLCMHTGGACHVPRAAVDTGRLDGASFQRSLWYACGWFVLSLVPFGKDWMMSLVRVTSAPGLWWPGPGPGKGRAGWPAGSGSVLQHTGRAACKRREEAAASDHCLSSYSVTSEQVCGNDRSAEVPELSWGGLCPL